MMIDKLAALIVAKLTEQFIAVALPKLLALLPVLVAAIVKELKEQVGGMLPGLDEVTDPAKLVDRARRTLNDLIPDVDIPGAGALNDLLDAWRPK